MPRKPREDVEGAVHHVFARGNDRQIIYRGDVDRRAYLVTLGDVVRRYRWRCMAYCLMENHVHLLLETPAGALGAGMQRLHGIYAAGFNKRHGRCGHLFQGRYGAVRVEDDAQLWTAVRYIARNPVEAALCSKPDGWEWSSHTLLVGMRAPRWLDSDRLLTYFTGLGGAPRDRYLRFVVES